MSILYTYIIMKLDIVRLILSIISIINLVIAVMFLIIGAEVKESGEYDEFLIKAAGITIILFLVCGILAVFLPGTEQARTLIELVR